MRKKLCIILSIVVLFTVILSRTVQAEIYEYDELNRVIKVTYDDGSYITYEYDKNGNITNVKVYKAETAEQEETTKKAQETTKKPQETTKKQEQETTKKPQETTKKQEQETTKKTQETTKKQEQETTKKKQEETTKKQQPETTKKSTEETTRYSEKPTKNPAKEEEETTKFQAPLRYPDTETDLINEKNNPVITHMTVSQPFEIIKNILQNFGGNTVHGKENTESGKNTETRSIIGNQSENGIKNGKSNKAGNYGQEGKGGNAAGGSTYRVVSLREKTAEFLNRKTPKVTKFMCKFILDITRVFVITGK